MSFCLVFFKIVDERVGKKKEKEKKKKKKEKKKKDTQNPRRSSKQLTVEAVNVGLENLVFFSFFLLM